MHLEDIKLLFSDPDIVLWGSIYIAVQFLIQAILCGFILELEYHFKTYHHSFFKLPFFSVCVKSKTTPNYRELNNYKEHNIFYCGRFSNLIQ